MECPASVVDEETPFEDVQVALCLRARGVPPLDPNEGCTPGDAGAERSERFHPLAPAEEASLLDWHSSFTGYFTRASGLQLISPASVVFHHMNSTSQFTDFEYRLYSCRGL